MLGRGRAVPAGGAALSPHAFGMKISGIPPKTDTGLVLCPGWNHRRQILGIIYVLLRFCGENWSCGSSRWAPGSVCSSGIKLELLLGCEGDFSQRVWDGKTCWWPSGMREFGVVMSLSQLNWTQPEWGQWGIPDPAALPIPFIWSHREVKRGSGSQEYLELMLPQAFGALE